MAKHTFQKYYAWVTKGWQIGYCTNTTTSEWGTDEKLVYQEGLTPAASVCTGCNSWTAENSSGSCTGAFSFPNGLIIGNEFRGFMECVVLPRCEKTANICALSTHGSYANYALGYGYGACDGCKCATVRIIDDGDGVTRWFGNGKRQRIRHDKNWYLWCSFQWLVLEIDWVGWE